MDKSTQPIAVFGASGAQGGPVARALLAAHRPVRAIARHAEHLQDLAAQGAEAVALELTDLPAVQKALEGVAGAFVHLPFIPVMEVVEAQARTVAQALEAASVPLTVFTLSGPAAREATGVLSFDTKARAYQLIQAARANVIIFEPVAYLGNLSAPFSAPGVVEDGELRYPLPASHRQPWISVEDQAALALAALNRPDLAGRTFRIGEQLTGPELAEGISAGLGRAIRYVPLTPARFAALITPVMGPQVGEALNHDYTVLGSRPQALALDTDSGAIRQELGLAATPLAQWARQQDWPGAAAIYSSLPR